MAKRRRDAECDRAHGKGHRLTETRRWQRQVGTDESRTREVGRMCTRLFWGCILVCVYECVHECAYMCECVCMYAPYGISVLVSVCVLV